MLKKVFYKIKKKISFIDKKQIIMSMFCISLLVFAYCFINYRQLVAVYNLQSDVAEKSKNMQIVLGGEAVGIKLLASGVLVMGVDREDTSLEIGDVILEANGQKIQSNTELEDIVKKSEGQCLNLKISRKDEEMYTSILPIIESISGEYKLGLWVKDSSAGVGTVTFYDKVTGKFASLGHGVTETKENYILPITAGGITSTNIYGITKGESKSAGELKGIVSNNIIGDISGNTDKGVFGTFIEKSYYENKEPIQIVNKSKIKEGEAKIYCTLDDNKINEYNIKIEKVLLTSEGNKNMIIKVTDEKLIEKTGGIVQGMSGSPIVQDGKLVGCVTHVFLNDPTRGYGVFIENMIEDMCSIE